jgi:hypothetical protein
MQGHDVRFGEGYIKGLLAGRRGHTTPYLSLRENFKADEDLVGWPLTMHAWPWYKVWERLYKSPIGWEEGTHTTLPIPESKL